MDSKAILNKIITMLGMENKQVELGGNANAGGPFYGKLEDGSPVMTDYFDVGHTLLVVREDGSKIAESVSLALNTSTNESPIGSHLQFILCM